MEKIEEIIKKKWFHIVLIVIGTVFILLGAFHSEIWYDESYTMALIYHDYDDIISIDSRDVHPVLYYLMLKTFTLIFGNSILSCRLFSVIAGILIGVLGFTHVRKDFGEKVGVSFTFLSFFLPFMSLYAMEIRMYIWTMLFVLLAGIYAYRISRENRMKNWSLFTIFSLAAAHCHYYGLATVMIINGLLLLYILFSKKLYENNSTNKKNYILKFVIVAIIQILGYLPWLYVFLQQAKTVSNDYWIQLNLVQTVVTPLVIQFYGKLNILIAIAFTGIMYSYLIYQIICSKKQKQKNGIIYLCFAVHFILYISMVLISIFIKPVMYDRYMLVTAGIFIFPFAYYLTYTPTKHQKIITAIVVTLIVILSIYNNGKIIKINYSSNNGGEIEYIKKQYTEGTIILYKDVLHDTYLQIKMPEYNWYLYSVNNNKNYENFSPPLNVIYDTNVLDEYHGKIIIIDHEKLNFYNELKEKYNFSNKIGVNYEYEEGDSL